MPMVVPRTLLVLVCLVLNHPAWGQAAIDITLKQGTASEAQTRDQLRGKILKDRVFSL